MTETTRSAARPDDLPAPETRDADGPRLDRTATALVGLAVALGIVLRFWPRSSLWLDEALTISISTLPIGEIGDALRRDGHPPLYYVLMHVWTAIGGESDWWVRALSGVISVAGFPLAYLAGRRIALRRGGDALGARRTGMLALAVMAILPYGIRYGAEARMYSLVITLASAGYLLVDDLLLARRVGRGRTLAAAGAALVAAALLWTHYWSMWVLGVVGLLAVWQSWRSPEPDRRVGARWLVGALVAGGVLFLPWVPTLLFQAERTGTPWGAAFGPIEVLTTTVVELSGDDLLAYVVVLLVTLAMVGAIVHRSGDRGAGDVGGRRGARRADPAAGPGRAAGGAGNARGRLGDGDSQLEHVLGALRRGDLPAPRARRRDRDRRAPLPRRRRRGPRRAGGARELDRARRSTDRPDRCRVGGDADHRGPLGGRRSRGDRRVSRPARRRGPTGPRPGQRARPASPSST